MNKNAFKGLMNVQLTDKIRTFNSYICNKKWDNR